MKGGVGYCGVDRKVILVGLPLGDDDEVDALLVHEIAHATVSVGHGRAWKGRLASASAVADDRGWPA